jgi:hypothetical protein
MRKNECANPSRTTFHSFARNYHDRFTATVSRIGIDRTHLLQVVSTRLHDARGVIVPLADVIGAKLACPSCGEQSSQSSHASVEPACAPGGVLRRR